MKEYPKYVIYLLLLLFVSHFINAQENIEVIGTLIEEETAQTVPYATLVFNNKDTKEIITGTTSDDNGVFSVMVSNTNFYLVISYMGYKTETITDFRIENFELVIER